MTGQPILVGQFGADLVLVVEIAWGADLTDQDGSGWTWTDVTADALCVADQVAFTLGRSDEASTTQPATCNFSLDNAGNLYSQSPLGANWPYVRQGTPVRVRMVLSGTSYTRFQGYATGFTPGWDASAQVAVTKVSANGVLRRLGQGSDPLQSALRHSIPDNSALIGYWPLEDGTTSTSIASGLHGGAPMSINGAPQLADNSDFPSSAPIATLATGYLLGFTAASATGSCQIRFLAAFPDSGSASPDQSCILRFWTAGTAQKWELLYDTGGSLELVGFDANGAQFYDSGAIAFNVDGSLLRVSVGLTQNGSDIHARISTLPLGLGAEAGFLDLTVPSATITNCYAVALNPNGDQASLSVGHLTVEDTTSNIFDSLAEFNAFVGESGGDRFVRLCAENGVDSTVQGSTVTSMGAQTMDTLVNLLREIETANLGMLADGLSPGLLYIDRAVQENAAAAVTIDAAEQLSTDFAPVDDDQLLKNRWTVSRTGGSSALSQDTDGPLGTDVVGVYADSKTVNEQSDSSLQPLADWLVHQFTVPGYRYPALPIDFHITPTLAAGWLADGGLLSRVDVTGVSSVLTQMPDADISLLVQGFSETIDQVSWHLDSNMAPFGPWRIATIAEETGDTSEFLWRLDTDGSQIHTDASAGDTSLSVAVTSGPLWTTEADDMPLDLDVGGIRVTATAITGTTSPQTVTVTGSTVTKDLPAGTAVAVWNPPALGL